VAASANVGVLVVDIIMFMIVTGAEDRPKLGDAQEVPEKKYSDTSEPCPEMRNANGAITISSTRETLELRGAREEAGPPAPGLGLVTWLAHVLSNRISTGWVVGRPSRCGRVRPPRVATDASVRPTSRAPRAKPKLNGSRVPQRVSHPPEPEIRARSGLRLVTHGCGRACRGSVSGAWLSSTSMSILG